MLFNSPLSSEKAKRLVALLELSPDSRVLDVGCGRGEFLVNALATSGAQGIGVDTSAECIAAARESAVARLAAGQCEFREGKIQSESFEAGSFSVAMCIGSTHAYGEGDTAYPNTIAQLSRVVRDGGLILIGEGYWKREPEAAYLDLLGEPVGIYYDHAHNIAFAEARGLVPLYATVSNDDEWDDFEWSHRMNFERQALARLDDAAIQEKLQHSRQWRDGYLRWGRSTMGFGFYLFMKPVFTAP